MSTEPSRKPTREEDDEAASGSVRPDTDDGPTAITRDPSEHGEEPDSGPVSDSETSDHPLLPG